MPRLGRALTPAFNRLWVAAASSNLGDGVVLAAGPLLLAARFGLLAPFWFAFALVAVMVVLAWRRLASVEPHAARSQSR